MKKKNNFIWVGHRGAGGDFVANTMEAFEEGIARGAKALECDIRVTKDNKFIIFHNPYLNDTYGERVLSEPKSGSTPESKNYSELIEMIVTQNRGSSLGPARLYNGKMAGLDEYLDLCKKHNVEAIIEIKWTTGLNNNDQSNVSLLVDFVKSKGMYQKTYFMTSMFEVLKAIRSKYPDARLQFLCSSKKRYKEFKEECFKKNISLDIDYKHLNKSIIDSFHAKGLIVNTYTLNKRRKAISFIRKGVDMITTDYLYFKDGKVVEYKR